MPSEIWERIGAFLLPDKGLGTCYRAIRELLHLSLTCSNINSALAPTRQVGKAILQRIRLKEVYIWPAILDELLSDGRQAESAHSTYFSVLCSHCLRRYKPLLYYDGPEGKWVGTAGGLLRKLGLRGVVRETNTAAITDALGTAINDLSMLVTTSRDYPIDKLTCGEVVSGDLELFPLVDASVDVIAEAIIEERHSWHTNEVFDFYSLAFKPMSEPALLAYEEYTRFVYKI